MEQKPMLKGYRTYIAIALTALFFGLGQMGIIPASYNDIIVTVLSALGLYYRSQA